MLNIPKIHHFFQKIGKEGDDLIFAWENTREFIHCRGFKNSHSHIRIQTHIGEIFDMRSTPQSLGKKAPVIPSVTHDAMHCTYLSLRLAFNFKALC